jgi:hypothetical protein
MHGKFPHTPPNETKSAGLRGIPLRMRPGRAAIPIFAFRAIERVSRTRIERVGRAGFARPQRGTEWRFIIPWGERFAQILTKLEAT